MDTSERSDLKIYHYAYRLTDISTGKHYMGIRSSKVEPLFDLGFRYFTSSKDSEFVKKFKDNPLQFKRKILRVFKTREESLKYEVKYHKRLNVKNNPFFINRSNQTVVFFDVSNTIVVLIDDTYFRIPCEKYRKGDHITPTTGLFGPLNPNYGNHLSNYAKNQISKKIPEWLFVRMRTIIHFEYRKWNLMIMMVFLVLLKTQ